MPVLKQSAKRGERLVLVRSRSFVVKTRVHRHDFSFQNRTENPYVSEEGNTKIKILASIMCLALVSIVGLLFFHPAFRISIITITGLERTDYAEVRTTAENILLSKKFGFFPRNNYFLVDRSELQGIIAERFLLESVTVNKKFPNSLFISVRERQPAIVVLKDSLLTAVDVNGLTVEKIGRYDASTSSTTVNTIIGKPWNNLPFLAYASDTQSNQEKDRELVEGVLAWDHFLNDSLNAQALNYTVEAQTSGTITIKGGWKLLVNFSANREAQFTALNAVLKQKNINVKNIQYIDVRYPGKVYWQ